MAQARIGDIITTYDNHDVTPSRLWELIEPITQERLKDHPFWQEYVDHFTEHFPTWSHAQVERAAADACCTIFPGMENHRGLQLMRYMAHGELELLLHGIKVRYHGKRFADENKVDFTALAKYATSPGYFDTLDEEMQKYYSAVKKGSRPSIRCKKCDEALGVRLPEGPKGEACPLVCVRGPHSATDTCTKLWWQTLGSHRVLRCSYSRLHDGLGILHGLAFPDTEKHLHECEAKEFHREIEFIRADESLMDTIRNDWTHVLGIAQIIRWKNSAKAVASSESGRVEIRTHSPLLALADVPIPYYQGYQDLTFKTTRLPIDGVMLIRGTLGCCPQCSTVQRLE